METEARRKILAPLPGFEQINYQPTEETSKNGIGFDRPLQNINCSKTFVD
jgi:hypothetical protein